MSDMSIADRLRDTSTVCLASYEAWEKDKKNTAASVDLASAVHELRKVASRLEIEMAASDRDNGRQRPLEPPTHKTKRPAGSRDEEMSAEIETKRPRQRRTRKPSNNSGE